LIGCSDLCSGPIFPIAASWALLWHQDSTAATVSEATSNPSFKTNGRLCIDEIYRSLAIVSFHNPATAEPKDKTVELPFQITYNVWKPATTYRKSAPPSPDFRVAVVDARTTSIPTATQIGSLLESTPYAPPTGNAEKQLYGRLRHGYRNVVLAIVDNGVISYLRMSDSGFGNEKLYLQRATKGGIKRGQSARRGQGVRGRGR